MITSTSNSAGVSLFSISLRRDRTRMKRSHHFRHYCRQLYSLPNHCSGDPLFRHDCLLYGVFLSSNCTRIQSQPQHDKSNIESVVEPLLNKFEFSNSQPAARKVGLKLSRLDRLEAVSSLTRSVNQPRNRAMQKSMLDYT